MAITNCKSPIPHDNPPIVSLSNPRLFAAVLVGWIISVILHEFAHGIVAYWGGDYTIKERGGLTLNPLQYIHPVFSIVVPVLILIIGGVPLPGGATYIRRDLLRSVFWDTAVSLAGPAMDFLVFLACAIPLHPHFGWVNPRAGPEGWTNPQLFMAALALLNLVAMILNLAPVPPLDGFQAIAPYLPDEIREKAMTPPLTYIIFFVYFMIISNAPGVWHFIASVFNTLLFLMGFDRETIIFFWRAYEMALR